MTFEFEIHLQIVISDICQCACEACGETFPTDAMKSITSDYVAEKVGEAEGFDRDGSYCPICIADWIKTYPEPSIEESDARWYEQSRGFRMMDRDTLLSPNNGL